MIASLQSTVVMDEMYSLHVSNFGGKEEFLEELDQEEANTKFQELILGGINSPNSD